MFPGGIYGLAGFRPGFAKGSAEASKACPPARDDSGRPGSAGQGLDPPACLGEALRRSLVVDCPVPTSSSRGRGVLHCRWQPRRMI